MKNQLGPKQLEWIVKAAYSKASEHLFFGGVVNLIQTKHDSSVPVAKLNKSGVLYYNLYSGLSVVEWEYVFYKFAFHLGLGHFGKIKSNPLVWNAACNLAAARFMQDVKVKIPDRYLIYDIIGGDEDDLYDRFNKFGIPDEYQCLFLNGVNRPEFCYNDERVNFYWREKRDADYFKKAFSVNLRRGLSRSLALATGKISSLDEKIPEKSQYRQAYDWVVNNYPLLSAVAANYKLIEDKELCQRLGIHIAAINPFLGEIYINSSFRVNLEEAKFIIAHEILHAALMHHRRIEDRDDYFWNLACDFVINNWLIQMQVGTMPMVGFYHDDSLLHLSAEEVYDEIVKNRRKYRKLRTFKGEGKCDCAFEQGWWERGLGVSLDELCRQGLSDGLQIHIGGDRGLLPANLVEEIRRITAAPIPWDVQLARWFDEHFPLPERRRTYARRSRRQSATTIPLPSYYYPKTEEEYTYGIVLDTSGSMDRRLLGISLGAIVAYSEARNIKKIRLVYNDAAHYDCGFVSVDSLLQDVEIRGRGGTVLQPAFDYLEKQHDFPKTAPILCITDGFFEDSLGVKREHAFLIPKGNKLPIKTHKPVFYFEET